MPPMRRLCLVIVVLLTIAPVPTSARRQAGLKPIWLGSATVHWSFQPGIAFPGSDWNGSLSDTRAIELRVKEVGQRSVVDANGRLIGQVVQFEDAGTTWSGKVTESENQGGDIRLTGRGAGSGGATVMGVMYRSAVTPNPLADVIPDGTYTLYVVMNGAIPYTMKVIEDGKVVDSSDESSASSMFVGDALIGVALGRGGSTEASMRAAVRMPPPPGVIVGDRLRALISDRMSGEATLNGTGDALGSTHVVTWDLGLLLDLHPQLEDVAKTWRPDWMTQVTLKASIDPSLGVKGRFRFTLSDVSQEKGYALNKGRETTPDLAFADVQSTPMTPQPSPSNISIVVTTADVTEATVTIDVRDYGAWGRLKADVLVSGHWYPATTSRGHAFTSLPIDDNANHIADEWEELAGIVGHPANEDADSGPAGANDGDGFSNYEEYRGFYVNTEWQSTDPTIKDLFVYNESTPEDGCGYTSQSGVVCQTILLDEYDGDRVVNFNRAHATAGPQKGLHLMSEALGAGIMGQAFPAVGPPNDIDVIKIDHLKLQEALDTAAATGATGTALELIRKSVTAHEIGHGLNVYHHGDHTVGGTCSTSPDQLIAPWQGAFSGDRSCVMSYSVASRYQWRDGTCYDWAWPSEFGTKFCRSKAGTGFNAGSDRVVDGRPMPVSGDATVGDCQHAIRIKK